MNQSTDTQGTEDKTATSSKTPANDRQSTSDAEQLADHLRSIEGVDDDIAEVLANNWQRVLGALLLVLIAVVLVHQFRGAKATRQAGAAERLSATQRAYQGIINQPVDEAPVDKAPVEQPESADPGAGDPETSDPEAGDPKAAAEQEVEKTDAASTQEQIFDENSGLLISTNQGTVYADFAVLYQATRALRAGDFAEARSKLEQYQVKPPFPEGSISDRDVLISELASLLYARVQVAEGGDLSAARDYLKTLVSQRRLVALEALVMLIRLSNTDETLSESKALAKALQKRRPELADLVTRELNTMGITLDES